MTASTASNTSSAPGARRLIGRRAIVALAIGASATLGLSACGAGQIAQTSSQVAGVTGSSGVSANGAISVLDVQLLYPSQEDAREQNLLQASFTAVNADPVNPDTLVSITVNGHELKLGEGDFTIAPNSAISTPALPAYLPTAGATGSAPTTSTTPAETATPAETTESDATSTTPTTSTTATKAAGAEHLPAVVTLGAIDNAKIGAVGESVNVTFTFANAGDITIPTPVAVWHDVPRHPDSQLTTHE